MPKGWVKLHRKVVLSRNLNEAARENPFAERLYFRIIASADHYGRLCADPWLLRGRALPLQENGFDEIEAAVDVLEEHELIRRYEIDDEAFLVLTTHWDYQTRNWATIGKSEFPPPPDWEENHPESLDKFLQEHGHKPQFPASRYGLGEEIIPHKFSADKLQEWSKLVKEQSENVCDICGSTRNLKSHHIKPKEKFPDFAYDVSNGVVLCSPCHGAAHQGKFPEYLITDDISAESNEPNHIGSDIYDEPNVTNQDVDVDVDRDKDNGESARARELKSKNQKVDFNSDVPPVIQQDTGRPYDEIEIGQVLEAALPESVWRELKSLWSNKLTRILNADTEPLTLTDIYQLLQEYPPTLDQRYPDGWLRQVRYKRDKAEQQKRQRPTKRLEQFQREHADELGLI